MRNTLFTGGLVLTLLAGVGACGPDPGPPSGGNGGSGADGGSGGGTSGGAGGGAGTGVNGGSGGASTVIEPDPTDPSSPYSEADLDGDGIADQLEMEGFMWDPAARKFARWNLDPSVRRYFTDPNLRSTDGDPYPDSMEISGIQMDASVVPPGSEPLVPAVPRVTAVLESYRITLLQEVTLTDGGSIESTDSWTSTLEQSSASTKEQSASVSVGATVGAKVGFPAFGEVSSELSVTQETTRSSSFTTSESTAFSNGRASTTSRQWSRATTVNSGAAAQLSLIVSFANDGNAAAADIKPTFDLLIGGRLIRSFTSELVIDRLDAGVSFRSEFSPEDLVLSIDELAMLEAGAPVTLRMSQAAITVAREIDGIFQRAERWSDYIGRTLPTSARVRLDDGDGGTNDFLVYASQSPTAPVIRLRDAIVAGALGRDEGGALTASVFTADRTERRVSLDGWSLTLDPTTYATFAAYVDDPRFDLMALPLKPGASIRLFPGYTQDGTRVHFASFLPDGNLVVGASDSAFAASALEVTATSSGQEPLRLEVGLDGLFRTTTAPPVPRWGGIMTVRARNPVAVEADGEGAVLEIPNGQVIAEGSGRFRVTSLDPFGAPAKPPFFPAEVFDVRTGRVGTFQVLGGRDGVCSNQAEFTVDGKACTRDSDCLQDATHDEICAQLAKPRCMPRLASWQTVSQGIYLRGDMDPFQRMSAEMHGFYADHDGKAIRSCNLKYQGAPPASLRELEPSHPALVNCNQEQRWKPLTDFPPDAYGGKKESNDAICNGNRDNSVPLLGDLNSFSDPCGPVDYAFQSPPPGTRPENIGAFRLTVVRFPRLAHCRPTPGVTELDVDYQYIVYDLAQFAR